MSLPEPEHPQSSPAAPAPSRRRALRIERAVTLRPLPDVADLRFGQIFTDHMFRAEHQGRAWQDARIVPLAPLSLDPAAAGLHYGQTIFEGLKAFRGVDRKLRLFRLDRHVQRLARSAARLCMPAPDAALVGEALRALCRIDERWAPGAPGTALYLRPTLI